LLSPCHHHLYPSCHCSICLDDRWRSHGLRS
jgi:hypothetical protein